MAETISLPALKSFIEKKLKKKVLVKLMWNDHGKLTLFITPNMKINSFIYDEKEGYLFYDHEGKPVTYTIPCIVTEEEMLNGNIILDGGLKINNSPLSKDDNTFLREKCRRN